MNPQHLKMLVLTSAIAIATAACGDEISKDKKVFQDNNSTANNVSSNNTSSNNSNTNNANNVDPNNTNNANNVDPNNTNTNNVDPNNTNNNVDPNNMIVNNPAVCGDGDIHPDETCDDGADNGKYGYCNQDCTGSGEFCGDNLMNGGESCDGTAAFSATCRSLGFTEGNLSCSNVCNFDVSDCTLCGDGIVEGNETCDDGANNGRYGYCNATCNAQGARCGDGIKNGNEACDGNDMGGATCSNQGAGIGTVSCTASCNVDVAQCSMAPLAGEVIFTEIMNNPNVDLDNDGEWFEVYNTTNRTIDLGGCVVTSTTSVGAEAFTVFGTQLIGPGGYFAFARSNNAPFVADYVYNGLINLNNTTDALGLECGAVIDEVAWDDGATFPDPTGASMSLDPASFNDFSNDFGSNWCLATSSFGNGDLGTPGSANPSCP